MTNELVTTSWQLMETQSKSLFKSGFLPAEIKTEEQAMALITFGSELGLGPWESFQKITVIKGKPTLNAFGMLAAVKKYLPKLELDYLVMTEKECKVEVFLKGWNNVKTVSFTMEEAKKGGYTSKDNWKRMPTEMLRARCITRMVRAYFPECLGPAQISSEEMADIVVEEKPALPYMPTTIISNFGPVETTATVALPDYAGDVQFEKAPILDARPTDVMPTKKISVEEAQKIYPKKEPELLDMDRVDKLFFAYKTDLGIPEGHVEILMSLKKTEFTVETFGKLYDRYKELKADPEQLKITKLELAEEINNLKGTK